MSSTATSSRRPLQCPRRFDGNPADLDYAAGLLAVIDANKTTGVSHVSTFHVDEKGDLTPDGVATIDGVATNGVVVISREDAFGHRGR